MTASELLVELRAHPLIASVQASEGSPVDDPETLLKLAQASLEQDVRVLRLQGVRNIQRIRAATKAPTIGLIKRGYEGSEVYITPSSDEVSELLALGCEVIALDGTRRARPCAQKLEHLIAQIHAGGALAMADCDSLDSARYSAQCGADLIGTTLAGYTKESCTGSTGPNLDLLRSICTEIDLPVVAEGRYSQSWQVEAALRIGATGVVAGGALNDPVKQTKALMPIKCPQETVAAVDIGGTWLRFATFSADWKLIEVERTPLLEDPEDRLEWIRQQIRSKGVKTVGVGTGGVVDPATGEVWEAKAIIPGHIGMVFSEQTLGVPTVALNDGLASAWGHACLPQYAGKRVATLALGTGVGCGFVAEGKISMGVRGEYPRLNDLPAPGGKTFEQLLGGAALTPNPTDEQKADAIKAFLQASITIQEMLFPEEIVVCGSVGLSDWLAPFLEGRGLSRSPFGSDAGLYGAAALALFPPY